MKPAFYSTSNGYNYTTFYSTSNRYNKEERCNRVNIFYSSIKTVGATVCGQTCGA